MAIQTFNSVDGFSVGSNTVVIDDSANVTANSLSVTNNANVTGNLRVTANANIGNITTGTFAANGAVSFTNTFTLNNGTADGGTADEGGELRLVKPTANTTLAGNINIDIYQNKLRFFEGGGNARGAYIDLTACGDVASTNLLVAGSYGDSNVAAYLAGGTDTSNIITTGNVSGAYILGNGSSLTSLTGANVTGTVSSATTAGTVTTAAQSNITSVGTLTSLTVSGVSNLNAVGNVIITGGTTGQVLTTDGSGNLSWTTSSSTGDVEFSGTQMFGPSGNGIIDLAFNTNKDLLLAAAGNIANIEIHTYADGSNNKIWTLTPAGDMFAPGNITASGNVTANGVSSNLIRRGYGMVTANTNVTLDNIRAQLGGSPTRLQISTVSGTMTAAGQSQTMLSGSTATASWINVSLSTTPTAMSGAIANNGEVAVLNFTDQGAGTGAWRVTGMIANTSSNQYSVTIERLV